MAQPIGTTAYAPLPAVTTDPSGAFRLTVKPTKRTTYKAGFPGIAPEPTAVVLVKHSITLRAVRRSGKLYLRGAVGPRHARRVVVVQKRRGTRWITIARSGRRGARRSSSSCTSRTRSPYRARIAADREHLANVSRVVRG